MPPDEPIDWLRTVTPIPPVELDDLEDIVSDDDAYDECEYGYYRRDGECIHSDCEMHNPRQASSRTPHHELMNYTTKAEEILGYFPKPPTTLVDDLDDKKITAKRLKTILKNFREFDGQQVRSIAQPVYFGVELEVFTRHGISALIEAFKQHMGDTPWLIFKRDATIEGGAEIVTAPMTLTEHHRKWPAVQGVLREHAKGWKQPGCGLHVHLSRGEDWWALSQLQIAKMVQFIHSYKNIKFLEALGGRKATQYCTFETQKRPLRVRDNRGDRHEALNLCKDPTIEVRFFASTTKVPRILMAVEFASCLREYVQSVSIEGCSDMMQFVKFAQANIRQYPNLNLYLTHVQQKKLNLENIADDVVTDEIEKQIKRALTQGPTQSLHQNVSDLNVLLRFKEYILEQSIGGAYELTVKLYRDALKSLKGDHPWQKEVQ